MKVCGIQLRTVWEDPSATFERVETLSEAAAEAGARLLVLPEMFATGFSMRVDLLGRMAPLIDSFVQGLAHDLQVTIVAGMARSIPGDPEKKGSNMAIAYGPDGQLLAQYQKIHPFSYGEEHRHYRGGDRVVCFEVEGIRIAPFICYDLRFPEIFRAVAAHVDMMLVIANWPGVRRHAWKSLLVARAIENQCYVLGVNRVGSGGGLEYSGDSLLVDPLGALICEAGEEEGLVPGAVSNARVLEVREQFPFLKDRRLELYERLQPGLSPTDPVE